MVAVRYAAPSEPVRPLIQRRHRSAPVASAVPSTTTAPQPSIHGVTGSPSSSAP